MIEVHGLVKRYGGKTAVNGLTFTVQPGVVTGFLGPNGAGKSTTMRLIVGLDALASAHGIGRRRVAEVLDLADPQVLILDEPAGAGRNPA